MKIRSLALVTAALSALGLVAALPSSAAAPKIAAPSSSHPYSSPAWYPLLSSNSKIDCAASNPGCESTGHTDDSITFGTTTDGAEPVTAAGAGIVHIGADSTSDTCPAAGPHTLGNWVWIDHGGGVLSRYAHLQKSLRVTEGQFVAAGQTLGLTGNSGLTLQDSNCASIRYLNFQIQHGVRTSGERVGTPYPIGQLKACSRPVAGAEQVLLPSFQYPQYTSWNQVPQTTAFAEPGTTCIPNTAPNTPPQPKNVSLVTNGPQRLKFTWTKPTTGPTIKYIEYEFQYYSSTLKRWAYVDASKPFTSITVGSSFPTTRYFLNLKSRFQYRARVWFNGGDGWSLEGYWKYCTAT